MRYGQLRSSTAPLLIDKVARSKRSRPILGRDTIGACNHACAGPMLHPCSPRRSAIASLRGFTWRVLIERSPSRVCTCSRAWRALSCIRADCTELSNESGGCTENGDASELATQSCRVAADGAFGPSSMFEVELGASGAPSTLPPHWPVSTVHAWKDSLFAC